MLHVEFQMQLIVQVRAVGKAPAYAAQVPAVAASLNSGDVFIAVTADKVYTWAGDSSTEEEHATAADVAEKLLAGATTREPVSVTEGEETASGQPLVAKVRPSLLLVLSLAASVKLHAGTAVGQSCARPKMRVVEVCRRCCCDSVHSGALRSVLAVSNTDGYK